MHEPTPRPLLGHDHQGDGHDWTLLEQALSYELAHAGTPAASSIVDVYLAQTLEEEDRDEAPALVDALRRAWNAQLA